MFKTLTAWVLAVMAGVSFILTGCGKEEAKIEKAPVKATESTEKNKSVLDQSTPQTTYKAFLQAIVENDMETMSALILPAVKSQFDDEESVLKECIKEMTRSRDQMKKLTDTLNNPAKLKKLTDDMASDGKIVKFKGKYYVAEPEL